MNRRIQLDKGKELMVRRKRIHMTQANLAAQVGCHRTTIVDMEKNVRNAKYGLVFDVEKFIEAIERERGIDQEHGVIGQ